MSEQQQQVAEEVVEQAVEQVAEQAPERDWEAEASKLGWRPPGEFKGDEKKYIGAQEFVERGEQMLPLVQSENKRLKEEMAALKRDVKRAQDFFSKSEKRAMDQALAQLKREQEAAVESGDVDAFRAVDKKIDELRDDMASEVAPGPANDGDRMEGFISWRERNEWYGKDDLKTMFADKVASDLMRELHLDPAKGQFLTPEHLDRVAARVTERFPEKQDEKPKPRSAVEAPSSARRMPGQKTFSDLPADAQRVCDRWIKSGIIKSRDDYVANYKWN